MSLFYLKAFIENTGETNFNMSDNKYLQNCAL